MNVSVLRTNRRLLLGSGLAGATSLVLAPADMQTLAQSATPTKDVGQVAGMAWSFVLHAYQDPYQGTLLSPEQPDPKMRYIGAEVEIVNSSHEALNFDPYDIRLVDVNGVQFRSGGAVGSSPRINALNLVPGERTRGWVYYQVTADVKLAEMLYVAPAPQFRVNLPQ